MNIRSTYFISICICSHYSSPLPKSSSTCKGYRHRRNRNWETVIIGMEKRQYPNYSTIDSQVSCGCAVLIIQLNSPFDPLFPLVAWLLKTFVYLQRNMRRVLTEAPVLHLLSDNPFFYQVAGYTAMRVFRVSVCGLQGWCIWMKSRSAFVSICLEHKSVASRGVDA